MVPYACAALSPNERMVRVNQEGEFVSADPPVPSNLYTTGALDVEAVLDTGKTIIVNVVAFSEGERYDRMVERMRAVI